MRIAGDVTDPAALAELGRRLARARIRADLTQAELAREAGVGVATVGRLEAGQAVGSDKLVRVLRALGLLEGLDGLVAEPRPSPLELLEREGGRRRVRHPRREPGPARETVPWRWGDEGGAHG